MPEMQIEEREIAQERHSASARLRGSDIAKMSALGPGGALTGLIELLLVSFWIESVSEMLKEDARNPRSAFLRLQLAEYNIKKKWNEQALLDKWSDKLHLHSQTLSFKTAGWAGEKRCTSDSDLQL